MLCNEILYITYNKDISKKPHTNTQNFNYILI